MKQILFSILVIFCMSSCKKIIQVNASSAPAQLVIEGKITDLFEKQTVTLSETIGYDGVEKNPRVSGADVTVTDSKGKVFKFIEVAKGMYENKMQGVVGVTYQLKVNIDAKEYVASSTLPKVVEIDSLGVVTNSFFGRERINPIVYFTDPKDETNFYHFNLLVNGKISKRTYVASDRLTNGRVNEVQLFYDDEENTRLKPGDKLTIEMECVDKNIYNYWYSLSQQFGNGPNQGSTPANPTSNVSNGALGYFSANTHQAITVTIK